MDNIDNGNESVAPTHQQTDESADTSLQAQHCDEAEVDAPINFSEDVLAKLSLRSAILEGCALKPEDAEALAREFGEHNSIMNVDLLQKEFISNGFSESQALYIAELAKKAINTALETNIRADDMMARDMAADLEARIHKKVGDDGLHAAKSKLDEFFGTLGLERADMARLPLNKQATLLNKILEQKNTNPLEFTGRNTSLRPENRYTTPEQQAAWDSCANRVAKLFK